MINGSFLKKAALVLSCLMVFPLHSTVAAQEEDSRVSVYGRIFQLSKIGGDTRFANTGKHHSCALGEDAAKAVHASGDGGLAHSGTVFGEYKPAHAFNIVGGGFALGCRVQNTRFEFETLINGEGRLADSTEAQFYGLAAVPTEVTEKGDKANGVKDIAAAKEAAEGLKGVRHTAVGPMNFDKFSYAAALFNIYQDLASGDMLRLYVGGGLGLSRVNYNLTSSQAVTTIPLVAQGKVGLSFDLGELGGLGMIPYVGYSALYFSEKAAKSYITDLPSHKMSKDAKKPCDKKGGIPGLNFLPVSKHMLHNVEFGITFSLDT